MITRSRLATMTALALPSLLASAARAGESLQEYAAKCDAAIGVTVPDFNCANGTVIPTTSYAGGTGPCDRPNRLNKVCDPNSTFQVLHRSPTVEIVGLCRKKGRPDGKYGDIAVIQHNKSNGSTCFYQSDLASQLDGDVKAPSRGEAAWPWLSPAMTAINACAGCHDNGPIIRSPYLTQITGVNAVPGKDDAAYNRTQPYRFIGGDFSTWKAYSVQVGNTCTSCHRMGANNVTSGGAARDLGIRATNMTESNKNPHSATSPIWMLPGQITFSQSSADAAAAVRNCALRLGENPLPNSSSCAITQYSTTESAPGVAPPVATYAQAEQILGSYSRLLNRRPTNQEYRQALWLVKDGGSQTNLDNLILQPQVDAPRMLNVKPGDSRADLLCHDAVSGGKWADYADSSGHFNTSGFDWQTTTNFCGHATGVIYKGDFNNDGLGDLLCHDFDTGFRWIDYANATTGQFNGTNWSTTANSFCSHYNGRIYVGDFNGDGFSDLLCHDIGNGDKYIDFANTSGQLNGTNWSAASGFCGHSTGRLYVGKFNADNRDDLLCHDVVTGSKWIDYADSNGQFNASGFDWGPTGDFCSHSTGRLYVGDFNGDGRTDLLCHDVVTGAKWIDYVDSSGRFNLSGADWQGGDFCQQSSGRLYVGRFNDDTKDDLLCHDVFSGAKWIDYADASGHFNSSGFDWGGTGDFCSHDEGELH